MARWWRRRGASTAGRRSRPYRAGLASHPGGYGRPLAPKTLLESHRAILCFLRSARREGYGIDERILDLVAPRVPQKEPTVYHIAQLHKILDARSPEVPTEELVVRLLVGSGMRRAEVCGVAVVGPDGLPDVMTDSMRRGRVELRVRWDAGAKGRKSRRVPITPKLATAIKRYEARHRRDSEHPNLLISEHGRPYENAGVKSMMDRLQHRTGFHVHAHAFRHTFATVATLARRGVVLESNLTWLQPSLLIDTTTGTGRGERTASWLRRNGATSQEAEKAVERAANDLRTPPRPARAGRGGRPPGGAGDSREQRPQALAGRGTRAGDAASVAGGRGPRPPASAAPGLGLRARQLVPKRTTRREPPRSGPTATASGSLIGRHQFAGSSQRVAPGDRSEQGCTTVAPCWS